MFIRMFVFWWSTHSDTYKYSIRNVYTNVCVLVVHPFGYIQILYSQCLYECLCFGGPPIRIHTNTLFAMFIRMFVFWWSNHSDTYKYSIRNVYTNVCVLVVHPFGYIQILCSQCLYECLCFGGPPIRIHKNTLFAIFIGMFVFWWSTHSDTYKYSIRNVYTNVCVLVVHPFGYIQILYSQCLYECLCFGGPPIRIHTNTLFAMFIRMFVFWWSTHSDTYKYSIRNVYTNVCVLVVHPFGYIQILYSQCLYECLCFGGPPIRIHTNTLFAMFIRMFVFWWSTHSDTYKYSVRNVYTNVCVLVVHPFGYIQILCSQCLYECLCFGGPPIRIHTNTLFAMFIRMFVFWWSTHSDTYKYSVRNVYTNVCVLVVHPFGYIQILYSQCLYECLCFGGPPIRIHTNTLFAMFIRMFVFWWSTHSDTYKYSVRNVYTNVCVLVVHPFGYIQILYSQCLYECLCFGGPPIRIHTNTLFAMFIRMFVFWWSTHSDTYKYSIRNVYRNVCVLVVHPFGYIQILYSQCLYECLCFGGPPIRIHTNTLFAMFIRMFVFWWSK